MEGVDKVEIHGIVFRMVDCKRPIRTVYDRNPTYPEVENGVQKVRVCKKENLIIFLGIGNDRIKDEPARNDYRSAPITEPDNLEDPRLETVLVSGTVVGDIMVDYLLNNKIEL